MSYFVAGFFLIKQSTEKYESLDGSVVHAFTPSLCVCRLFPGESSLNWTQTPKADQESLRATLNLSVVEFTNYQKKADLLFEEGSFMWPNVFTSLAAARGFYHSYLEHLADVRLIGIELPETHLEQAIESSAPQIGEGESGLHFLLGKRIKALNPEAIFLGHEVLGLELGGHCHSLLCNHLQKDYARKLAIDLNENLLVANLEDAIKAAKFTNREDVGAEPVDWFPFRLVSYAVR